MTDRFREWMNPDLGGAYDRSAFEPTEALPVDIRAGESQPAGTIGFDKIIRRAYAAPPTTGQILELFTFGNDITKALITYWGIGSPQFDFFGQNEYFLAINRSAPMDQQFEIVGGPGPAASFFGGVPVGTLQQPKIVKIPARAGDAVSVIIAPQTTPAAGVVAYNIWTRVGGYMWR